MEEEDEGHAPSSSSQLVPSSASIPPLLTLPSPPCFHHLELKLVPYPNPLDGLKGIGLVAQDPGDGDVDGDERGRLNNRSSTR